MITAETLGYRDKLDRNDSLLMDNLYFMLINITKHIVDREEYDPALLEAYDSLLNTYFAAEDDGF